MQLRGDGLTSSSSRRTGREAKGRQEGEGGRAVSLQRRRRRLRLQQSSTATRASAKDAGTCSRGL